MIILFGKVQKLSNCVGFSHSLQHSNKPSDHFFFIVRRQNIQLLFKILLFFSPHTEYFTDLEGRKEEDASLHWDFYSSSLFGKEPRKP